MGIISLNLLLKLNLNLMHSNLSKKHNSRALNTTDDEDEDFMEIIDGLSGFGSLVDSIIGMFGPAEPTLQDIITLVLKEINTIFLTDLADDSLKDMAANLQTVQDFIAINYANAVNSGEDKQALYTLLTEDNSSPPLATLHDIIAKIDSWAEEFENSPNASQDSIACQAIALSLSGYIYYTMIFKERAKVYWTADPDPNATIAGIKAEWANVTQYAAIAVERIRPIVNALLVYRISMLQVIDINGYNVMTDLYIDPSSQNASLTVSPASSWIPAFSLFKAFYQTALFTGTGESFSSLFKEYQILLSIANYEFPLPALESFIGDTWGKVMVFGQWAQHVESLLDKLTALSTAPNPFLPA